VLKLLNKLLFPLFFMFYKMIQSKTSIINIRNNKHEND